ncbi:MAG: MFS transporter [Pseudonocardiales bacterium]|nr:MFS transporter [Pseudonocardiales bacterium]
MAVRAPALSRSGLRRVLVVLCVTEIVSYGVLFYAFPVLAAGITADTGWSTGTITAAFSLALVVSAAVGVPLGRVLDRIGPRLVMTASSVLAVPAVLGIAAAGSLPWFVASWVLAGVAMGGLFYPPAFAALTRWWGARAGTALTALTLAAGLSSTIFAPLTAALDGALGWRGTYVVLAGVLAVVTVPAHLLGLRGAWPEVSPSGRAAADDPALVARSRPFALLVGALTLGTFAAYAVIVNQVPLLVERGLTPAAAAWALGLGGLGQVLGRLCWGPLVAWTGVRARTVLVLAASAAATGLLAALPGPAVLLVAGAMLAGAASGILTLLQATAVSDRWGAAHYGRLSGILAAPVTLATALAPWAGAATAELLGGYPAVFGLLAAVAALSAVLAVGSVPRRPVPAGDQMGMASGS